jgi:hypothetical protein
MKRWLRRDPETVRKQERISQVLPGDEASGGLYLVTPKVRPFFVERSVFKKETSARILTDKAFDVVESVIGHPLWCLLAGDFSAITIAQKVL